MPISEQRDLLKDFVEAHPDKTNFDAIATMWISMEMGYWEQTQAVACAARYRESAEVARGAIMRATKFMVEQRKNGWKGEWARAPTVPKTASQITRSEVISGLEAIDRLKGRI